MAKAITKTSVKAATKRANDQASKSDKPKRQPTAYNLFVKAQMKPWLDAHQGSTVKEGMKEIGLLWRDAPENPNRGKEVKKPAAKTRKPKAAAEDDLPDAEESDD
ncbi:hypothetical protein BJ138DRAFT_1158257 [Hygrophoropsis aurantiaca]|uniref:Uncharacterized protein n=1 Tax=Hygrophoropsis aurantiaca TaxID=72124 RepID=A0ACB8A433_9AGAM|nr:hypothetical protein BJ138DRAFT_1158257 [Hygrophoropsis aurantiaca]